MTTGNTIIAALETRPELEMKPEGGGRYRLNSPLRPGSNSRGFVVTIDPDGEHGTYFDHVTEDGGSLYELAERLGITPTGSRAAPVITKRAYDGLPDYAAAHGAPVDAFRAAGWSDVVTRNSRPALSFKTKTGTRYRFIDGEKPVYINERGYRRCWYGLRRAVSIAAESGQPIVICNGEASTVTAQYHGLPACAVTGGEKAHLPDDLLAELRQAYTGRVLIAFDCDKKGRTAAPELAAQFRRAGLDAAAVDLGGTDGFDLADFCKLHTDRAAEKITQCPPITPAPDKPAKGKKPTDDELAERWQESAPRTAFGLGDWRRYRRGIWAAIPAETVKQEMKGVCQAAKGEGVKPSANLVNSVSEMARLEVFIEPERWDNRPEYLVCGNGALHIPTLTLKPHNPELYATTGVGYDYDPEAFAVNWGNFLLATFTPEVEAFLQEFAGYALTTDTKHEIALWLYSPPGRGKSTFITGLEAMLGNRAGLLGLADIERSRFALQGLPGKTLVIATEQPGHYIASTDVLNAIISGEKITIDRKFRDPVEVTPKAKICWAMNELPRVSDPNSGLFRRVKVIEFNRPVTHPDPELKAKIAGEAAGILNWALAGLKRLSERGRFAVPDEIIAATDDFKQGNDIPALFVAECCITGSDERGEPYRVKSGQLYAAYKDWCTENGHKPQSLTTIANDWRRLGFEKEKRMDGNYWANVGLVQNTEL